MGKRPMPSQCSKKQQNVDRDHGSQTCKSFSRICCITGPLRLAEWLQLPDFITSLLLKTSAVVPPITLSLKSTCIGLKSKFFFCHLAFFPPPLLFCISFQITLPYRVCLISQFLYVFGFSPCLESWNAILFFFV